MKNGDEIDEILALMREHGLAEFELEREDFKIRLKKEPPGGFEAVQRPVAQARSEVAPGAPPAAVATAGEPAVESEAQTPGVELAVVKSPIVGTFYRATEPGAPNFVEIGDTVRKGQVLCIVEAMKLMNEIESEYEGEVVAVYVDNGVPVQYGERLFAIKASGA